VHCYLVAEPTLRAQAGESTVAIPLDAIERTLRINARDVELTDGRQEVVLDGKPLPFIPLATLLGTQRAGAVTPASWSTVIVSTAQGRAAVGVDRLLDTTHAVLKPLGRYAPAKPFVAGATLSSRGAAELVLEPSELVHAVAQGRAPAASGPHKRGAVLVIDDSLTTRMLEQSILESAGYEVGVAASAEEGLQAARRERRYDLFLVDVEMPGMDGFELVTRVRADPRLKDTPAILVTSRNAPEARARGAAVGADGYIVKSEFDQVALLKLIASLVR